MDNTFIGDYSIRGLVMIPHSNLDWLHDKELKEQKKDYEMWRQWKAWKDSLKENENEKKSD